MRLATPSDVPAIMAALRDMLKISPAPQMKYADVMQAELGVRHAVHEERAVFVGDYFIMYDIGSPWYSTSKFLIEDIILRVHSIHGNKVADAISALDELKEKHGCIAVVVGDTQIGYMAPKYIKAGYTSMGQQLLKG